MSLIPLLIYVNTIFHFFLTSLWPLTLLAKYSQRNLTDNSNILVGNSSICWGQICCGSCSSGSSLEDETAPERGRLPRRNPGNRDEGIPVRAWLRQTHLNHGFAAGLSCRLYKTIAVTAVLSLASGEYLQEISVLSQDNVCY